MGMATNFVYEAASRRSGPMLATSIFMTNHGPGLSNLVDIVDDHRAIEAVCDLGANHAQISPCPNLSRRAIGIILNALERVSASEAERLSRHWNIDIGGATLWYGARLTDLHGRFKASPQIADMRFAGPQAETPAALFYSEHRQDAGGIIRLFRPGLRSRRIAQVRQLLHGKSAAAILPDGGADLLSDQRLHARRRMQGAPTPMARNSF